jgi:LCP family protein required for cell wall assembly
LIPVSGGGLPASNQEVTVTNRPLPDASPSPPNPTTTQMHPNDAQLTSRLVEITAPSDAPDLTPTPSAISNIAASPSPTATRPLPTPLPWDGMERVNLLVMGIDARDESLEPDIPRTDSMILLTLDPVRKTGGMLSIPRDLWVKIPGMNEHKINTAYRWGELYDLPGGGPGVAMKTVQGVVGVPVNYYLLIDFNAFIQFIDDLGGLDMHIREAIVVDPIGPGNTVTLEPGVQTLSGALALAYARNRHTALDDFDRSTRQQEVILAIREQILTFDMLPDLILKAPQLARDLSAGIQTNLTIDQIIRLAWTAGQVPEANIRRSVFDHRQDFIYDTVETSDGLLKILRLKPGRIERLRKEMFGR